jgi:uncharacterized YigZ family protein
MNYLSPKGVGQSEISEKHSRFLGYIAPVSSETGAMAEIEKIRVSERDARHHCWCYILRDGGAFRYTDDGEPQGTAGRPIYELLSREGIFNVVCVVTRYFGGVLLGPGGLSRAYTAAAKAALADAGTVPFTRKARVEVETAYSLGDTIKALAKTSGGLIEGVAYTENVTLTVLLNPEDAQPFTDRVAELSGGAARCVNQGETYVEKS